MVEYATWKPTGVPYWRTTNEGRRHAITRYKPTPEGTIFYTMCGVTTITPSYPGNQEACESCETAFRETAEV